MISKFSLRFHADRTAWNALDYLSLYRLFVASLFVGLFFTPLMHDTMPSRLLIQAHGLTVAYLLLSPTLFILGRRWQKKLWLQASFGLLMDVFGTLVAIRSMGGVNSGAGVLLIGTVGVAGVLMPLRMALGFAAMTTLLLIWGTLIGLLGPRNLATITASGMFGGVYFATAWLGSYLASRVREGQALVSKRSADLANLAELNEMIIQRMRTGILIIDRNNYMQVMNSAAWYLTGMPHKRAGRLEILAPDLLDSLTHWRSNGSHLNEPLSLAHGVPQVIPRFAPLSTDADSDVLAFLEDTSIVSRRAQELTLASLGRLSASIAHEIRNPLAAISHSSQLLAESEGLDEPDRRLTAIIERHCARMNDIIENVLQLARQEPARPERLRLGEWLEMFVEEFKRHQELGEHRIVLEIEGEVLAQVDPGQLQQVIWNLCQNALKYGRQPDQPANVRLRARYLADQIGPVIEVIDAGPGIDAVAQERIFQPFFTSSRDGTGLGLYLCQQLCASNQATLTYQPGPDGGSLFRIELPTDPGLPNSSAALEKAKTHRPIF